MTGHTDGIDVGLASPLLGALRKSWESRHGQFAVGDRVKDLRYPDFGTVVAVTTKRVRVLWDRHSDYNDLSIWKALCNPSSIAHVEPTVSGSTGISGEAKS